jgi:predicted metalloenzyme YecM
VLLVGSVFFLELIYATCMASIQFLLPESLQTSADEYTAALKRFLDTQGLTEYFIPPVDHLAVKATDAQDYMHYMELILPFSEEISYVPLNNRRLATAKLTNPISFGELGETVYLEIMEPRPEKVGKDFTGFEHIELLCKDFNAVESVLKAKNIPYEMCENPEHRALVLKINDLGQEIKFTDKSLGQIVLNQVDRNEAVVIK